MATIPLNHDNVNRRTKALVNMTNHSTGHLAEEYAAEYLKGRGYEIIGMNWKTRLCEIDVIASKDKAVHFFEVKYRKNDLAGSGLEYITSAKLRQMKFAAQMWVQENEWEGDYSLGAIEVSGPGFEITSFVPEL